MECKIKKLDKTTAEFFPHPNQPFDIIGRIVPVYNGESWTYREIPHNENRCKAYRDETLDPGDYIDNKKQAVFLAFCGEKCVGSVRVSAGWLKKGYIEDLAVDKEYRRSGVGKRLMDSAVSWCREQGQGAVSLETQNNNLQACRFYIKYGFELCGINTKKYALSEKYSDEIALYFYMKL